MKSLFQSSRLVLAALFFPLVSFAEEGVHAAVGGNTLTAIGAGLGIAVAVFGAALAQGRIAAAFMTGVSRNPGAANVMRTPLILSLIFVETLVLFTLLIALNLAGKA